MMTNKYNPKMITLAREARGLSQTQLSEITGISRSNISRFEQDDIQMSEIYILSIFDSLKFHPSLYHYRGEILTPELYRKRDNVPARILSKTDANVNLYRINLAQFLESIAFQPSKLPLLPSGEDFSPSEAAIKLRKLWKVAKGPIENLVALAEEHGVIILPYDFETERVLSTSLLVNGKFPLIFYNSQLMGDRQRYIISYELGHLIMHTRIHPDYSKDLVMEAREFADEFLMPSQEISKEFKEGVTFDSIGRQKTFWKVPMYSLFKRSEGLGFLTESQKRQLKDTFNKYKIRRREPKELDIALEQPCLLRDLLTSYRSKQKMSLKQMAEKFYYYEEEFLQRYGFEAGSKKADKVSNFELMNN